MESAPSRRLQGVAEEIVEVNVGEKEIVGYLDAPNKDTNTLCLPPLGQTILTHWRNKLF